MLSKIIKASFVISIVFMLTALTGIYAYATEGNIETRQVVRSTEVLDQFKVSLEDLSRLVKTNEASAFIEPSFGILELENLRRDLIKDFGTLELTTGFSRSRISTFSRTKPLMGVGTDKTVVGIYVFHYEVVTNKITQQTTTSIVATQDRLVNIGLSGLFNESINLDHIGDNYVFLAVKSPIDQSVITRLFKIVRKEERIQESLENIKISFY